MIYISVHRTSPRCASVRVTHADYHRWPGRHFEILAFELAITEAMRPRAVVREAALALLDLVQTCGDWPVEMPVCASPAKPRTPLAGTQLELPLGPGPTG